MTPRQSALVPPAAPSAPLSATRAKAQWLFEGPGFMPVNLVADVALLLVGMAVARALTSQEADLVDFVLPVLTLALLAWRRSYSREAQIPLLDRLATVLLASAVTAVASAGVEALTDPDAKDAAFVVEEAAYGWLLLSGWRILFFNARETARRRRWSGTPTLIVGAGDVGAHLEHRLTQLTGLGMIPVGFLDSDPLPDEEAGRREAAVLGPPAELGEVIDAEHVGHVILAFQSRPDRSLRPLVRACEERHVMVSVVPRLFDDTTNRIVLEHIGGLPIFVLRQIDPQGWQFAIKDAFDRVASALLLVVFSPLFLAAAIAVRASSPGPVLYRQRRIGRDGAAFDILKFRSMRPAPPDTPAAGPGEGLAPGGVEGADRRTRVGTFLRRSSIDELPQLLNVVRGEMSLVGPRPERPEFARRFDEDVYRYGERLRVRSGLTGWAQVNGLRGKTSIEDRAEWDNFYIQNWSFWLDVKILLMTVPALLRRAE